MAPPAGHRMNLTSALRVHMAKGGRIWIVLLWICSRIPCAGIGPMMSERAAPLENYSLIFSTGA